MPIATGSGTACSRVPPPEPKLARAARAVWLYARSASVVGHKSQSLLLHRETLCLNVRARCERRYRSLPFRKLPDYGGVTRLQ